DDTVLLHCFARAFGCVDGNNKVDEAGLRKLAGEWYGYWRLVNFESESTLKEINDKIEKEIEEARKQAEQRQNDNNNNGRPGMFPGAPGGFPGAPGGAQPPGSPPGGNIPPTRPRRGGN
ncbi:MAG TPA: hypothetical protein VMG10_23030, partial [Gemmataceae bacterium]|nr:hypothetical protein [Gemmataceae bacterium]